MAACWAQSGALLLVVSDKGSQRTQQLNEQLSGLITQTGRPMARPLVYDFQNPRHRDYCERQLGIGGGQLPLLAIVTTNRSGGVTSVISPYPRVDQDPALLQAAVEKWSGEKVHVARAVTTLTGGTPDGGNPWRLAGASPRVATNAIQFEKIMAKRGGPPFHVLNVRVRLRNQGSNSVHGLSIAVYVREAQRPNWTLLTEWRDLPNLQPGYRMSRDHVGSSSAIGSPDFRVKVVVNSSEGTYEQEAGPASPEEDEIW